SSVDPSSSPSGPSSLRTLVLRPVVEGHLASVAFFTVAVLDVGNVLDRDHALSFRGIEHDHPLRRAAHDADAFHRNADQLTPVGDEHDLVAFLYWEGADQLAVPLVHGHSDDAFAAASGDAVLVGRRALAVAVL